MVALTEVDVSGEEQTTSETVQEEENGEAQEAGNTMSL